MKKYRYNNADIYVAEQENYEVGLGQVDKKQVLKDIYFDNNKPAVAINCSYFTNDYVVGRNQGDTYQGTPDKAGWCLVHDDEGWHCGQYKSWEYTKNVDAGFSVATLLIKDGEDCELLSTDIISDAASKLNTLNPQTAIAITNEDKAIFIVVDGRSSKSAGLTGYTLRDFVKEHYDNIKYLAQLDGGGSSEMVVDRNTINKPSDGTGRSMWNALVFYGDNIVKPDPQKAILSFSTGSSEMLSGISQKEGIGSHIKNLANDFNGKSASDKCYLKAPYDCIVRAIGTYDNTVFFESLGKVITPSGTYNNCFFMCTHMLDADLKALGIKVGKIFKQGEICYREGVKGIGSGNHMHIEVGTGKFNGNSQPYKWEGEYFNYNGTSYKLYVPCTDGKECHIYDMMYLDNINTTSNIKSIYNWIYTDSIIPSPVDKDENKNQVHVQVSDLRIRTSMSTANTANVVGCCVEDAYYDVDSTKEENGYLWYKLTAEANLYVAHVEGAITYYEKEVIPEEPEEPEQIEIVPVERDTNRDQVKVVVDNLRVRKTPSLDGNLVCIAKEGFYNILYTIRNTDYTWYQIEKNAYIANVEGAVEYYGKESSSSSDDEQLFALLRQKVTELENKNKDLENQVKEVEEAYNNYKKEVESNLNVIIDTANELL